MSKEKQKSKGLKKKKQKLSTGLKRRCQKNLKVKRKMWKQKGLKKQL